MRLKQIAKMFVETTVALMLVLMSSLSACSALEPQPMDQATSSLPQASGDAKAVVDMVGGHTSVPDDKCPNPSFARAIANGITFYAGHYRADQAGRLMVDFCFDQVDTKDWTLEETHLVDRQGHKAYPSESELLEVRFPPKMIDGEMKQWILDLRVGSQDYYIDADPNQKMGQRTVSVTYHLPPDFDVASFTIAVESIIAYPSEGEQCSDVLISKLQQALDEKQTGIKIKLRTESGMCGWEIVQKPKDISVEEAMSKVGDNEMWLDLFGIRGPWIFEGSVK